VFREKASEPVYSGRNFKVFKKTFQGPKGSFIVDIVEHPGAVVILPLKQDNRIVFIKQYRYVVEEELLELPAGTIKDGEDPFHCALRELEEETGLKAGKLRLLGIHYASPGHSTELYYSFLAEDLKRGKESPEIDEEIRTVEYSLSEVLELIRKGEIRDSKTLATIMLFLMYLGFSTEKLL